MCLLRRSLALTLLWLAWATQSAQAWAFGPYNDDWKAELQQQQHHAAPPAQPLVYRVVRPRNGTAPTFGGNGTYTTGRTNATGAAPLSTSTSTPTPVANSSTGIDTSCGTTSPLYTLQVVPAADGSPFDNWWLALSGNSVLFTPRRDKATAFGVNAGTGHLCVPRDGHLPLVAIVETRLDTSPLYFLDSNFSTNYQPEYQPVVCKSLGGGGSLACALEDLTSWSGCGLQLGLGSGQDNAGGFGSLNCSSITLGASKSSA